jgi:hypothetical protein
LFTFTISIVVFFGGAGLNRCVAPLRRWNIPDAVTGGLASLVTLVAYRVFGLEIAFDLDARDISTSPMPGHRLFREMSGRRSFAGGRASHALFSYRLLGNPQGSQPSLH